MFNIYSFLYRVLMKRILQVTLTFLLILFVIIPNSYGQNVKKRHKESAVQGHLFIIGGGTGKLDYVVILPMSSEEPDSSVIFAKEDFASVGITHVVGFNFVENGPVAPSRLDSIRNAKLVFITGGDQTRFMKIVGKGPIYSAIHGAYANGSTIAGTSAGAAVMSKKMITGNNLKHKEFSGRYPVIESGNIEINEGLGLVDNMIVDQHFIKRQRMNRLIAVALENPDEICAGIDESTAIIVTGNKFTVAGENQVIVLCNTHKNKKIEGKLMGGRGLELNVLLPGETYNIK
jgi:cyanophycinase